MKPIRCIAVLLSVVLSLEIHDSAVCDLNGQESNSTKEQDSDLQQRITELTDDLGSDQFRRRKAATRELIALGTDAVDTLAKVLVSGDLETLQRVTHVLTEIALRQSPSNDGGAWGKLVELQQSGAGSREALATTAIEEIREVRQTMAIEALEQAGVFIGLRDFVVGSISENVMLVEIDESWSGDLEALSWLRWVQEIERARLKGKAVREDVIEQLVKMPDLNTIALMESQVSIESIAKMHNMKRINSLELLYVPVDVAISEEIAKLPLRVSLNLMGTGLPEAEVEKMRKKLPGLSIGHKQGGFLGVSCVSTFDVCRINEIVRGSAAENAGLIPGDEIVGIDDANVKRFEDLQNAINQKLPGDEVLVRFRRGDKIDAVKLELGKRSSR